MTRLATKASVNIGIISATITAATKTSNGNGRTNTSNEVGLLHPFCCKSAKYTRATKTGVNTGTNTDKANTARIYSVTFLSEKYTPPAMAPSTFSKKEGAALLLTCVI